MELGEFPFTPAEQRFGDRAVAYALAYNRAMAGYLHLSSADLAEPADCFANPRVRAWPSGEVVRE